MTNYHSYDPNDGHRLPHNPIKAIIAPRPIGWISSVDLEGRANLAPYSFFNIVSENPPILMFSSEGRKDTIRNIEDTGEFVFNLVTLPQARAMNLTSAAWPADVDEFKAARLEKIASEVVAAPRVAGTPAAMECKLLDIRRLVDINGRDVGAEIVTGQIVRVHILQDALIGGKFDIIKAQTIARAGYRGDYVDVKETFEMLRPANLKNATDDGNGDMKAMG
ncbi:MULTISPECIES: flavin reductase family protein [unclassified Brenneria]|uniref:flavin reductase family protein n=1 Tax=unclassified Brenneria TaxID=2634434 RepID=UPI0029C1ACE2|nr:MULTISPECIES: flavin reductase family protein [unclassified Brenneria]MDX5630845.1 flavin reductase family protein [Brenneria sp. L3-3Z]MDX5697927.1 flavin reductase family protein [Brenneria sp. L4-2C]